MLGCLYVALHKADLGWQQLIHTLRISTRHATTPASCKMQETHHLPSLGTRVQKERAGDQTGGDHTRTMLCSICRLIIQLRKYAAASQQPQCAQTYKTPLSHR